MKRFDVKCPFRGKVNHDLFLEETQGWMECSNCRSDVRVKQRMLLRNLKGQPSLPVRRILMTSA